MVVSANRFASQRKASTCGPWAVGWVGGEREKGEEQDLDVGEIGDNFISHHNIVTMPYGPSIVVDNIVPAVPSLSFIRRCVSSGMTA